MYISVYLHYVRNIIIIIIIIIIHVTHTVILAFEVRHKSFRCGGEGGREGGVILNQTCPSAEQWRRGTVYVEWHVGMEEYCFIV